MSQSNFSALNLSTALLTNLDSLGYKAMTAIQAQSLPSILSGEDVIAQSKTGSGKTAAFGLALLEKLNVKRYCIQSLVLCPTRELADQVAKEIRRLGRGIPNIKILTLCGGVPLGPQAGSLAHGAHIIVGTPGRIQDHLHKGTLKLDNLTTLVLDEADRMLDMGFQDTLDIILQQVPKERQTLLFSATYPAQIQSIAKRIMKKPVLTQVESSHDNTSIQQIFYPVETDKQRITALRLLLLKHRPNATLVFCNTKVETQAVARELQQAGFSTLALHGDLEQRDRDQTLIRFANKSISVLVATDVAARGLDIDSLDAVINYQIARNSEVHVHRIGRTGRANKKGIACTLFSKKETHKISTLEEYLDDTITIESLPPANLLDEPTYKPAMTTLQIDGGKKQKVRPGDILGALTGKDGIKGAQVGKIDIFDRNAYVAVTRDAAQTALRTLGLGKLKGRTFKVRYLGNS